MVHKRFVFQKPYNMNGGIIQIGSELVVVNGIIYYNGGMLEPVYQIEFKDLIMKELKKPYYLKQLPIINNHNII